MITPAKFPNKSEYSKLLSGIRLWNNSKKIEITIKYKLKYLSFWEFLKVKKPIIDKTPKA